MEQMPTDHDLLIELRTEMRGMRIDIKDLKDGTSTQITTLFKKVDDLETFKASKNDLDTTNAQVNRMNTRLNMILGGLAVLNILLPIIYTVIYKVILK